MNESQNRCEKCSAAIGSAETVCENCRDGLKPETTTQSAGPLAQTGELSGSVGRYQLLRLLGKGGMGSVWEAFDTAVRRRVALKIVDGFDEMSAAQRQRFEREAWIGGRLNHSNIVRVFDAGVLGTQAFIAMELVEGGTLHTWIRRQREVLNDGATSASEPPARRIEELCRKFLGLARGLEHCHRQSVLHRDIKPLNVLVSQDDGRLLLSDFGLARDAELSRMTVKGDFMGTVPYMAPEQLMAHRAKVDQRSDIWSLGVTLYEGITLAYPFEADSEERYVTAIVTQDPVTPRQRQANIPRDLETIVLKCLRRDPRDRYQDGGEFADDLERYLQGRPIRARRLGWAERAARAMQRNMRIILVLVAAAALVGAVATIRFQSQRRQHLAREAEERLDALIQGDRAGMHPRSLSSGHPESFSSSLRDSVIHALTEAGWLRRREVIALIRRAGMGLSWTLPASAELGDSTQLSLSYVPNRLRMGDRTPQAVQFYGQVDESRWKPMRWFASNQDEKLRMTSAYSLGHLVDQPLAESPHQVRVRARIAWLDPPSLAARTVLARGRLMSGVGAVEDSLSDVWPKDSLRSEWRDLGSETISLYHSYRASFPRAIRNALSREDIARAVSVKTVRVVIVTLPDGSGEQLCFTYRLLDRDSVLHVDCKGAGTAAARKGNWVVAGRLEGLISEAAGLELALRASDFVPGLKEPLIVHGLALTREGVALGPWHRVGSGIITWTESGMPKSSPTSAFGAVGLLTQVSSKLPAGSYAGRLVFSADRAVATNYHFERFADGPDVEFPVTIEVTRQIATWCHEAH